MSFSSKKCFTFEINESVSDEEILKYLTKPSIFDENKSLSNQSSTPSTAPIIENVQKRQNNDYFEDLLSDNESFMEGAFLNTQGIMKMLKGSRNMNKDHICNHEYTNTTSSEENTPTNMYSYKNNLWIPAEQTNLIVITEDKVIDDYICNFESFKEKTG